MGAHGHNHEKLENSAFHVVVIWTIVVIAAATVLGVATLWPRGETPKRNEIYAPTYAAAVTDSRLAPCSDGAVINIEDPCSKLGFEVLEGPNKGEKGDLIVLLRGQDIVPSETIFVAYNEGLTSELRYSFVDVDRGPPVMWLAILFAAAVILLGRWKGLYALVGLGATIGTLFIFTLPSIAQGTNPLAVALVSAAAISFFAIYLSHGFNHMSNVALLGTVSSLAVVAFLSNAFTYIAKLGGFLTDEAVSLQLSGVSVDLQGLVLAGMIIGALGALDDMTVTQASAVLEINEANPSYTKRQLYDAGLRIGKDHVASTVNTLVLAYVGASLPLFLIIVVSNRSISEILNSQTFSTEIVRTLVGSIGLVLSVPITTILAASLLSRRSKDEIAENRGDDLEKGA